MALHVTDDTFGKEVLEAKEVVLVDFWAPWCGPCKAIGPVIEELAGDYDGKAKVCKMNVDECPATPGRYGIRSIPTLIVFKNGEVVDQRVGALPKQAIKDMIDRQMTA